MTPLMGRRHLRLATGRSRSSLRGEQGTSTIEFALGASLLFMTVCGIIAICFALYTYNIASEAARAGARFAIVRGSACTSFGTACPATSGNIQTYVQNLGFPGSGHMLATAAWSAYPAGGTCKHAGCNGPGDQVTVTVTDQFPVVIPFVPHRTLSMSSTAAMVISQ
jgi:Flp pilus assembly protein TadG